MRLSCECRILRARGGLAAVRGGGDKAIVNVEDGHIVPVLRDASRLDLSGVAGAVPSYKHLPDELSHGIVYRMWFDVSTDMISNDHCRASVRIKDEGGHDSAMRNAPIKADITGSSFRATRRGCEEAIIEVETDAGYEIGQIVLAQLDRRSLCKHGTKVAPGAAVILGGPHAEKSVVDDCAEAS